MDYAKLLATAKRLIGNSAQAKPNGREVTIRTTTGATYDPVTDTSSGGTVTDTSTYAVMVPEVYSLDPGTVRGDTGEAQYDTVMIMPGDVAISLTSSVMDGTDTFQVVDIDTIRPGDTAVVKTVKLRA